MTKLTPRSGKMGVDYLAKKFATFFSKFTEEWIYFTCPKMFWDSPVFFGPDKKLHALYVFGVAEKKYYASTKTEFN